MGPARTPPGAPGTLDRGGPPKSADAYRTISEVADVLRLPQHVLRFWETRFSQIKPMKRAGGRRFYRPDDVALLRAVQALLYDEGYTIKGVQRLLAEFGARHVAEAHARSRTTRAASANSDDASGDPGRAETGAGGGTGRGEPSGRVPDQAGPDGRANGERRASPRDGWVDGLNAVLDDLRECARLIASVRAKEL